jgi:hypothetical protein
MKYYYFLIFFSIILVSCNHETNLDKYISELPDSLMINDVLIQISKIDSFSLDYKISNKIVIPRVYKKQSWDNDSIPPPPPPPSSISYDDLYSFFMDSTNQRRFDDSIFIKFQVDTSRRFSVSKDLVKKFSNNSFRYYRFDIPIFSFDKQFVVVKYWRVCGGLCGHCHLVLLKKVKSQWIKIDSWGCGIM